MHHFAHLQELCAAYVAAHRARNRVRQEKAPQRRAFPPDFTPNLKAKLQGTMIYIRRANEHGCVQLLGRSFEVCQRWPHRLVRSEVNFTEQHIRFYALRRRDPQDQPLLHETAYTPKDKPFQGEL